MTDPTPLDAATLIDRWRAADLVSDTDAAAIAGAVVAAARDHEPPIHLKILSALGTFLATLFFLAFLGASRLIDFESGASLLGWGGVLLALGIGLSVGLRGATVGLGRDFAAQATFAAMALGKVMVVAGAVETWGLHPGVATAALAVVTVLTYPVSGSSLDRLVSPYAVAASALYDLVERGADPIVGLTLHYAVATAVAAGLLLSHRVPAALRPIGLAALAAMGTVVCILASGHDFGLWVSRKPIDPRPIEVLLTASLVGTIAWAAGGVGRLAREPLAAAVIGVVALGFVGAPGLIFALILLVLGHARHDLPMRVVGALALPGFLVLWYYGRDMTFLEKSAALVGSGALLLGARGVMALRGWDREGER